VGSSQTRLVVRFMISTASVRNILDTPSYRLISRFFKWSTSSYAMQHLIPTSNGNK
jgi:hypothetical protein